MTQASAAGRITLRLPGSWHAFNPRDDERAEREAHAYAKALAHSRDDAPLERARVAQQLLTMTNKAKDSDVETIFVCRELEAGVPFPAVITVLRFRPTDSDEATASPWPEATPERSARMLRAVLATRPDYAGGDFDEVPIGGVTGVRVIRAVTFTVTAAESGTDGADADGVDAEIESLTVDYWVPMPGRAQALCISCYSAIAQVPHLVTRLFDGIVADAVMG